MKLKHSLVILVLAASGFAQAQFWNTSEVMRLPGTVNTGAEETIPVFSQDLSALYFVRSMDPMNAGGSEDQDIWYSLRDAQGNYGECNRLKDLNNKFNNAVVGLGKADSKMYVLNTYLGKKDLVKGLAVSEGGGDAWKEPVVVEIPGLDIEGEFYGFHVSQDESVIIVSYAGPNTKGQEDLYVTTRSGAAWSPLTHMGSAINSAGFEIGPFLSKSKDTLFFSSNGMGGQGDADIFYSIRNGSWTNWSTPVNLGNKINSAKFDAYFSHNGKQAFWSSNRDGELSDIYMVEILTPPAVAVSCTANNASVFAGKDGSIQLSLTGGVAPFTYVWSNGATQKDLKGLAKGEYSVTVTDGLGRNATTSCTVGEPSEPVASFGELDFRYNFAYNKNKLTSNSPEFKAFLQAIEKQLTDGRKEITIRITSSASNVPTKTFGTNNQLAASRAKNIEQQLIDYFAKTTWKNAVKIEIGDVKVQGPAYDEDAQNTDRYDPYQFIELRTKK